MFFLLGNST